MQTLSNMIISNIYVGKHLGTKSIIFEEIFTPTHVRAGAISGHVVWAQLKKTKYLIKE
jgi:Na+/glutamate symporter